MTNSQLAKEIAHNEIIHCLCQMYLKEELTFKQLNESIKIIKSC